MSFRSSKFKTQNSGEAKALKAKSSREGGELVEWMAFGGWWVLRDGESASVNSGTEDRHPWDLERIVRLSKQIPRDPTNNRLIDQVVGAGTSVGANYCEASQSVSGRDFKNTIARCVKEAKETKFFLRMVVASEPQLADVARPLYREAHELLCIFASMWRK